MNYLGELSKLNLPKDQYAIFGSGPLAVRKLRENKDIDIIVTKELWNKLIKNKKFKLTKKGGLKMGHIEIFNSWHLIKESTEKLIKNSEMIKGFPFVKLKYVLKWKKIKKS